jgi:hypothetical protein
MHEIRGIWCEEAEFFQNVLSPNPKEEQSKSFYLMHRYSLEETKTMSGASKLFIDKSTDISNTQMSYSN